MWFFVWLGVFFLIGSIIGSGLNVFIYRLPRGRTPLWPPSSCGSCSQPIPIYHNIPILSYCLLRGRCRKCRQSYSPRYLVVEAFSGLMFVALYLLIAVVNHFDIPLAGAGRDELFTGGLHLPLVGMAFYYFVLFSTLLVAACIVWEGQKIPVSPGLVGSGFGLVMGSLFAWPFPTEPIEFKFRERLGQMTDTPFFGLQPAPFWYPLPQSIPMDSLESGFLTAVIGGMTGLFLIRLASRLMRPANVPGLSTLWMMAGIMLGWQITIISFLAALLSGMVYRRKTPSAFEYCSIGSIVIVLLSWPWLGPFFWRVVYR